MKGWQDGTKAQYEADVKSLQTRGCDGCIRNSGWHDDMCSICARAYKDNYDIKVSGGDE